MTTVTPDCSVSELDEEELLFDKILSDRESPFNAAQKRPDVELPFNAAVSDVKLPFNAAQKKDQAIADVDRILDQMKVLGQSIRNDCAEQLKALGSKLQDDVVTTLRKTSCRAAVHGDTGASPPGVVLVDHLCESSMSSGDFGVKSAGPGPLRAPDAKKHQETAKVTPSQLATAWAPPPEPKDSAFMHPDASRDSSFSIQSSGVEFRNTITKRDRGSSSVPLRFMTTVQRSNTTAQLMPKPRLRSLRSLLTMSVAEFISTGFFDNLVGGIIFLNAIVIGIQADYHANHGSGDAPTGFYVFELCFAVWFSMELCLRLYVHRLSFFNIYKEGYAWNYFDATVVFAQLFEMFFDLVVAQASGSSGRLMQMLRILRIFRILRVLRVLRLISELRAIVSSIAGSFSSLVWVVVLMLLMMYIVGVFFTQAVADHFVETKDDSPIRNDSEVAMRHYFKSLPRSMLTLWQAISGGVDWDAPAWPLYSEISFLTGFAFTAFIAFSVLALLNVVTGVFVQTALANARLAEDSFKQQEIEALIDKANLDDDETITKSELSASLADASVEKDWARIGLAAEDATWLLDMFDVDGTGSVCRDEFLGGCLRMTGEAKAIDVMILLQESRKSEEARKNAFAALASAVEVMQKEVQSMRENSRSNKLTDLTVTEA